MTRAIVLLLIGTAVGATGTYFFVADRYPSVRSASSSTAIGASAPLTAGSAVTSDSMAFGAVSVSARLALYELAVQSDIDELESLVTRAAALSDRAERRVRLSVLLARYAEIDPRRAVRFARESEIETELLLPLYQAWARADASAALDALSALAQPAEARAVGLAMLQVFGDDERSVSRVLAALPGAAAEEVRAEAIAARAERSPALALEQALALSDPMSQRAAVARIARAWAGQNPRAALAQASRISDPMLSATYQSAVVQHWARTDPDAALRYITTIGNADGAMQLQIVLGGTLQQVAQSDPLRVLDFAEQLRGPAAQMARQMAIQRFAQEDALAAVAYIERLPLGMERQQMLQMVAAQYGEQHPDAAMAWARNLRPPQPGVLAMVLGGLARTDFERAFEIALNETSPMERMQAVQQIVLNSEMGRGPRAARVADKLLTIQDQNVKQSTLQTLTSMWASRNPTEALEWLLAHDGQVGAGVFRQAAQQIAQSDPVTAASYTERVPAQLRSEWIMQVAQGYARVDPDGALSWLGQFRGEPAYESGMQSVAQYTAMYDPPAAARLLSNIDRDSNAHRDVAVMVAHSWAQQDPYSAAQWALDLDDRQTRSSALSGIAQQWAAQDSQTARSWVLSLPSGDTRDAALTQIVSVIAANETPDQRLLNAFSSETMQQQGIRSAVLGLAQRDPNEARAFADLYVSDPAARQHIEQVIESVAQTGFGPNGPAQLQFGISTGGGPVLMANPGGPVPFRRSMPESRRR